MPPCYLIQSFEDDIDAQKFVNDKAKEGYKLMGVSTTAVSSKERCTYPLVLRITVTMRDSHL